MSNDNWIPTVPDIDDEGDDHLLMDISMWDDPLMMNISMEDQQIVPQQPVDFEDDYQEDNQMNGDAEEEDPVVVDSEGANDVEMDDDFIYWMQYLTVDNNAIPDPDLHNPEDDVERRQPLNENSIYLVKDGLGSENEV